MNKKVTSREDAFEIIELAIDQNELLSKAFDLIAFQLGYVDQEREEPLVESYFAPEVFLH